MADEKQEPVIGLIDYTTQEPISDQEFIQILKEAEQTQDIDEKLRLLYPVSGIKGLLGGRKQLQVDGVEYSYGIDLRWAGWCDAVGTFVVDRLLPKIYIRMKHDIENRFDLCESLEEQKEFIGEELQHLRLPIQLVENALAKGETPSDDSGRVAYYTGYKDAKRKKQVSNFQQLGLKEPEKKVWGVDNNRMLCEMVATGIAAVGLEKMLLDLQVQVEQSLKEDQEADVFLSGLDLGAKEKIALLYKLGIIGRILEITNTGGTPNLSKAGRLIEVFTGIKSSTARKNLEAVEKPHAGNAKNYPLDPITSAEVDLTLSKLGIELSPLNQYPQKRGK